MASDRQDEVDLCKEHIEQLSNIDQDVVTLLKSAGLAVKALTQSQSEPHMQGSEATEFAERKESFSTAASEYFNVLASIDVRLRRQITALEEARIIPAEAVTEGTQSTLTSPPTNALTGLGNQSPAKQGNMRKGAVTGGGLGTLDVGWLNSRNDNVGKEMEAELWEESQRFIERFEAQLNTGQSRAQPGNEEESRESFQPSSIANDKMDES